MADVTLISVMAEGDLDVSDYITTLRLHNDLGEVEKTFLIPSYGTATGTEADVLKTLSRLMQLTFGLVAVEELDSE